MRYLSIRKYHIFGGLWGGASPLTIKKKGFLYYVSTFTKRNKIIARTSNQTFIRI